MKKVFLKYFRKLFTKRWVIGIARGSMQEMIRNKSFNSEIKWVPIKSTKKFYADPFIIKTPEGNYDILFENYSKTDSYGRIAVMSINKDLKKLDERIVLDTKSHLSYPFIFREDGRNYVFPEAGTTGKLSCYEYDIDTKSFRFLSEILDLPVLDATILKHNNKYWIFGIVREKDAYNEYKMVVFFSDKLLGPYTSHPLNPIKNDLNGTRSAGNFFEVEGAIYRPTQNCANVYGESITINKLCVLNETEIREEPYMAINIDAKKKGNARMKTIHTINSVDNIIVVDGLRSSFSPLTAIRELGKKKRIFLNAPKKVRFPRHIGHLQDSNS